MADKDITIGIKTTGTQESAKSIVQVDRAMSDLARTSQQDTIRSFEQVQDKAKVAEFAFYDLNNEIAKTKGTTETYTAGSTKMAASSRNNSQALLMFSQGLEDAQYGIRGVLNNIPGLVIALGGTAGLAGAISIVAVGLSQLDTLFGSTAKKAEDMSEKIGQIADNAGTLETERFEKLANAIDDSADAAAALKQNFTETQAASASLATSGVEDAAKIAAAQRNIAELLGLQVDAYQELEAAAARAEEKRNLAAQQQISAEQRKLQLARDAVADAGDLATEKKALANVEQANLVALRGQLEAIRQQRTELEKMVKIGAATQASARALAFDGISPSTQDFAAIEAGNKASKRLADPAFGATIKALEARTDALAAAVEGLTKDGGIVAKAENAFAAAQTKLTDITAAVGINIERIEQTLAADTLVARSEGLIASQQAQATSLNEALAKIETSNAAALQAKATIGTIVADGQITVTESDQLARASVQLIGQIQAGLATAGTNTTEVLNIIRQVATVEAANRREIEILKKQVFSLQR
jgi:hypothetical protein